MEIAKESCQDRYRRRSKEGEKTIMYKISSGKHIDDLYNYKIENISMYGKSAKSIPFIFSLKTYKNYLDSHHKMVSSAETSIATSQVSSYNSTGMTPSRKVKLVPYADSDADLSDEETEPGHIVLVSDDKYTENNSLIDKYEENEGMGEGDNENEKLHKKEDLLGGAVKLSLEPSRKCSKDFDKIKMKKKSFQNLTTYEELMLHCNIDELGTNFPQELYDGHLFGNESYYDELDKVQKEEMDSLNKRKKFLEDWEIEICSSCEI